MDKIEFRKAYEGDEDIYVVDWLASELDISKIKIKKIIDFGGLWIKEKKKKRVKKIKTLLKKGQKVEFYYDSKIEEQDLSAIKEVMPGKGFGVWYKPAGILADGTNFSDRSSMMYALKQLGKTPFLVHRLDREASGLMVFAYNKENARHFSRLLQENSIEKYYQAIAMGMMELGEDQIDLQLDRKSAKTLFKVVESDAGESQVEIDLITGRFHQIRRHFDMIGHPLIGDPKYGKGNKNRDGLKLCCHRLKFKTRDKKQMDIYLPQALRLF